MRARLELLCAGPEFNFVLRHKVGGFDVMPAVDRRVELCLQFAAHIEKARAARSEQPFMGVGGEKVHVLHIHWKSTNRLDGIEAKQDVALVEIFADGLVIQTVATDEMAGGQRHELGVFIHLAHDVHRPDHAQTARVDQAHLDATVGHGHPRINVGGIIIMVNQDVVAPAKGETGSDEAEGQRGGTDNGHFFRLAVEQLRTGLAGIIEPVHHEGFLVAQRGFGGAIGDRLGHAARQRANPGVPKESPVPGDGELRLAQFLVRENLVQVHPAKLIEKPGCEKNIPGEERRIPRAEGPPGYSPGWSESASGGLGRCTKPFSGL